jgi:hypothetical protein
MTKAPIPMPGRTRIERYEPTFEGDRKARNMSEITRRVDEEMEEEVRFDPVTTTGQASDYAQPDVRKLANLEEEIGKLAQQEAIPVLERSRDIGELGNSTGLKKAQTIITTAVTKAHDGACQAIDDQIAEARALLARIEKGGEDHKARLREAGQTIARNNGAAIQELLRTAEWYEKQAPNLREPKLEQPVESVPPIVETPSEEK